MIVSHQLVKVNARVKNLAFNALKAGIKIEKLEQFRYKRQNLTKKKCLLALRLFAEYQRKQSEKKLVRFIKHRVRVMLWAWNQQAIQDADRDEGKVLKFRQKQRMSRVFWRLKAVTDISRRARRVMRQWNLLVKARKLYKGGYTYKQDFRRVVSLAFGKLRLNKMQKQSEKRKVALIQGRKRAQYM